jgi:hypothetical protein
LRRRRSIPHGIGLSSSTSTAGDNEVPGDKFSASPSDTRQTPLLHWNMLEMCAVGCSASRAGGRVGADLSPERVRCPPKGASGFPFGQGTAPVRNTKIVHRISKVRARTIEELAVKARTIVWSEGKIDFSQLLRCPCCLTPATGNDVEMARSTVADLIAFSEPLSSKLHKSEKSNRDNHF